MTKGMVILTGMVLLLSCHRNEKSSHAPDSGSGTDAIILAQNSPIINKLEVKAVTSESHQSVLTTFGIVQAIPNNYAKIAAPFAGRIVKSFVRLGQKVNLNEPIFEFSSPLFFETGKMYYQAKQEMSLAEKNLLRETDLYNHGVGAKKELEEAEVNYEVKKRDYENAVAALKVFDVTPEELVLGQPLIVRSPIKGVVVENAIVLGQYLKEDADPVVCVAELSKVWIVGHVKEKDIMSVHASDATEVILPGLPQQPIHGRIYHISEMLDEETRSVKVFIECANENRDIKPGMYVSIRFIKNPENAILIPSTSVFQHEDSSYVYIQTMARTFEKRNIEIAGAENDRVIVKSGLTAADQLVVKGGIYLLEAGD
jgi:membrane fusion protein, heavy metal efflux system